MDKFINKIIQGDALDVLKTMPDECVDCVVTSPPYWNLRDYSVVGQLGLEPTFQEYISKLCDIFVEVKRVLKKEGTCWVNLGDTYGTGSGKDKNRVHSKQATLKGHLEKPKIKGYEKSLCMIPERFAIEMIGGGWKVRNKIIWHKKNAMPSSVVDRLNNKYELVFFFVKSPKYYFDLDSIRIPYEVNENRPAGPVRAREKGYNTKLGTKRRDMEENARKFGKRRPPSERTDYIQNPKGKNPGDVWTLTLQPHAFKHIAMFPEKLIEPMIKAGCPQGGVVLDPFAGACTTQVVAAKLGRKYIGIELNTGYIKICNERLSAVTSPLFVS